MDDQVTLSAYSEEIRTLIQNKRSDQALTLCQHILRYYPKHVDTYRQMAEASLERGDLEGARELFGRVLSADPENVVAYTGLAIIFEQQNLNDEALWHLERAYELSPANLEIRKELLRLYGEIESRPRARLKLTPGALARLYVQEGLYPQAIQEFRAIASHSPKRFDARVALVETLWRAGHVREAADVSQIILKSLPYSLKANLILGTVWQESGLKEGETFLQTAGALDPLNRVAQELLGARSPLRPADALVPRYVEGVTPTAAPEPTTETDFEQASATDWFATLPTITEETEPAAAESQEETPPTFEEPSEEEPPTGPLAEIEPVEEPLPEPTFPVEPVVEEPRVEPPSFEAETMEQLATTEPVAQAPQIEEPPVMPVAEAEPEIPAPPPIEPQPREVVAPKPAAPASDLPPWLRADIRAAAHASRPSARVTPKPTTAIPSSLPPWLTELQRTLSQTAAVHSPAEERGAGEPVEKKIEQPSTPMPAWLTEQPKTEGTEPVSEEPRQPAEEIVAPSWATIAPAPTAEEQVETTETEELPQWLTDLRGGTISEVPPAAEQVESAQVAEEIPAEQTPEEEPKAEFPDWLKSLQDRIAWASEQEAAAAEMASKSEMEIPAEPVAEEIALEEQEQPALEAAAEPVTDAVSSIEEETIQAQVAEPVIPLQEESVQPSPLTEPSLEFAEPEEELVAAQAQIAKVVETAPVESAAPAPTEPEYLAQPVESLPPTPVESVPSSVVETRTPERIPAPMLRRRREPKGSAQLAQARAQRDANRLDEALREYDYCVQHAPRLVNEVIRDLEALIEQPNVPLEAHRILGDAYTRADRLGEALERYRFVLDRVS